MNIHRRKWRFNPVGEKYGKLTVISEAEKIILPSGQKPRRFNCLCECGKMTNVLGLHLVRGRIISCGCVSKILNGESKTPICRAWKSMKERCSPKYSERHIYFDKGIKVCDEWDNDYFSFKKWAEKNGLVKGLQVDRIDNSKGYSPENCRVTTNKINVNNRDITFYINYRGEKVSLMLLLDKLGINKKHYPAIRGRIVRGWSHDLAIDTPIRNGNYGRKNMNKD